MTMTLSPVDAKIALRAEYERKMAELDAIAKAQADQVAAAAHLESTKTAHAQAEAARLLRAQHLADEFTTPSLAAFNAVHEHSHDWARRIDAAVAELKAVGEEQRGLFGEYINVAKEMGNRVDNMPSHLRDEAKKMAEQILDKEFANLPLWPPTLGAAPIAIHFNVGTNRGAGYIALKRILAQSNNPKGQAPMASAVVPTPTPLVPTLSTDESVTPLTQTKATPAKQVTKTTAQRMGLSIEGWLVTHTTKEGWTKGSVAYADYQKRCELLGIKAESQNAFAAELSDLQVEKRRAASGILYAFKLKE